MLFNLIVLLEYIDNFALLYYALNYAKINDGDIKAGITLVLYSQKY